MSETHPGWPPAAEELWLVHGVMGAPIATMNGDGTDKAVLLRVAARRNHGTEELDQTLLLDLETTTEVLSGLLQCANEAWGKEAVHDAMARALGMNEDAVAAAKARLKDQL